MLQLVVATPCSLEEGLGWSFGVLGHHPIDEGVAVLRAPVQHLMIELWTGLVLDVVGSANAEHVVVIDGNPIRERLVHRVDELGLTMRMRLIGTQEP